MKKEYLTPDVRLASICFEAAFLASNYHYGDVGGEDFDDPDDPFDPWS